MTGHLPSRDAAELAWQGASLCGQTGPDDETWYPNKGGSTRVAKALCRGCPVRVECLDYALEHDERFGVWGGLSERERHRLLQQAAPIPQPRQENIP